MTWKRTASFYHWMTPMDRFGGTLTTDREGAVKANLVGSNSMQRIYFATTNYLKFQEAGLACPGIEMLEVSLPEIQSTSVADVVRAKLEALAQLDFAERTTIVEDTGLEIETLNGLPGAFVKWFLQSLGPAGLARLARVDRSPVAARAVSAVGVLHGGRTEIWTGEAKGWIVDPRGEELGWNSIFEDVDSGNTFGEMTFLERYEVSMRKSPLEQAYLWIRSAHT